MKITSEPLIAFTLTITKTVAQKRPRPNSARTSILGTLLLPRTRLSIAIVTAGPKKPIIANSRMQFTIKGAGWGPRRIWSGRLAR